MEGIKILIALVLIVLFFLPIAILTFAKKLRFKMPDNKKNIIFLLFALGLIIVFAVIASLFNTIADFIVSIPLIGKLISNAANNTSANFDFVSFVIIALFVNLVALYSYLFLKLFFMGKMKKLEKKAKEKKQQESEENKETNEENKESSEETESKKTKNIPAFIHLFKKDKKEGNEKRNEFGEIIEEESDIEGGGFLKDLFFKGPDYLHVKPWVYKSVKIIRKFIILFEILYLIIFTILIFVLFYRVSDGMYKFLIDFLHINKWYIYPFLSLIFLQELCNIFDTTIPLGEVTVKKHEEVVEDDELARLGALQLEIKKRFDYEHHLRFFPALVKEEIPEYKTTNLPFESALKFIRDNMKFVSGHVVESYMESLDAMYNGNHVYFCASFYSEFGEYLITYAYTRLLAGERLIFVTSDSDKREHIKKYIKERLNILTHTTQDCTWRVYTSDERVDQADILIATPADFKDDSIAINYPVFFEEVSNAIFIDVDKTLINDSYICPIMSLRLLKATENRIRYIFLTDNVYRGLAASSLPKFFCIDKVASFSGARENENVTYTLWNRESKSHRIYNKYNQFLSTPESIVAELGIEYKVDGVRVITDSPFEHGEVASLTEHKAEINSFYKTIPNVNFMIYNDNRNNLSAAIYFCTRFRGKKQSIVHIMSKPYLLREYFASKMNYEDFINRSSFIQPRVTEHVNNQKLSLLRIFCEATVDTGMSIEEFENNIKNVITLALKRGDNFLCDYCKGLLTGRIKDNDYVNKNAVEIEESEQIIDLNELSTKELAAYLIAGLCDNLDTPIEESYGQKAKNYFIILDKNKTDGYRNSKQKNIIFSRSNEVFEIVLKSNERVSLFLNDRKIGTLNTFPARIKSEFVVGQRIVYNNVEYEIEQISSDYKTIFLKRENVNYKSVLDTIFLRRYNVDLKNRIGEAGVLYNTTTNLEKITVEMYHADVTGETYGFYNLLSDKQSIDFINGAQGNPLLDKNIIENNTRNIKNGKVLMATLKSRIKCNDKMRLLLSALLNEFIKTIFPEGYRSIAVVPILEEPFDFADDSIATEFEEHVKRIYPYLKKKNVTSKAEENCDEPLDIETDNNVELEELQDIPEVIISEETPEEDITNEEVEESEEETADEEVDETEEFSFEELRETNKKTLRFLFINDCENEDLGVLDWFYDSISLFMEEVLVNIYSYCAWLKPRISQKHYIYFGNETLPECFDLEGCCELLNGLNKILSDSGIKDYETAPEFEDELGVERCSFCHHIVESGRYSLFNNTRFICSDCYDVVETKEKLQELYNEVFKYLSDKFEYEKFNFANVEVGKQKFLEKGQELSEFYYDLDVLSRTVFVEFDLPVTNAKISILRALVALWQCDNDLVITESKGHLYYEEIQFLRSIGDEEAADWVLNALDEETKRVVLDIINYVNESTESAKNSFDYMREMGSFIDSFEEETEEEIEEEIEGIENFGTEGIDLYDPKDIPRFWKRFLKGIVDKTENEEDSTEDDMIDEQYNENSFGNAVYPKDLDDAPLFNPDEEEITEGDPIEEDPFEEDPIEEDPIEEDPIEEEPIKKKKSFWKKLFGKKEKGSEEPTEEEPIDPKKTTKKNKNKKKILESDTDKEDEEKYPEIKLYNAIVRHAYSYDTSGISYSGISAEKVGRIFKYVLCDYPDLFWVNWYDFDRNGDLIILFRCLNSKGEVDKNQVNKKRRELEKGAKKFVTGITKKTDPYKALITIYRRLITYIDYDDVGLSNNYNDIKRDDNLRSLHSALVTGKVVCAGYAVALQYLLHMVGLPCAYVSSEPDKSGGTHAFNVVKIGNRCYYVDVTWGDTSTTKNVENNNNIIRYDYCCVPYREFIMASKASQPNHIPRAKYYPYDVKYKATKYEYHRYHKYFLTRCNEKQIISIFVNTAKKYDPKVMGDFAVSIRCVSKELADTVFDYIWNKNFHRIIAAAKEILESEKNKKAVELLNGIKWAYAPSDTTVMLFASDSNASKKNKKKK